PATFSEPTWEWRRFENSRLSPITIPPSMAGRPAAWSTPSQDPVRMIFAEPYSTSGATVRWTLATFLIPARNPYFEDISLELPPVAQLSGIKLSGSLI